MKNETGGACSTCGGQEMCVRRLVGKQDGERPLGRPKHRWEAYIKTGFQEVIVGGMDWIDLAQDGDSWRALVDAVMKLHIP